MRDNSALAVVIEARPVAVLPVFIEHDAGDPFCLAELINRVARPVGSQIGIAHRSLRGSTIRANEEIEEQGRPVQLLPDSFLYPR